MLAALATIAQDRGQTMDYFHQAKGLLDYARTLRRDFHKHPELGFQESRTAAVIRQELEKHAFDVHPAIAETGVVATMRGSSPGPTLLLRADIDALPIREASGAEYASRNPGVMHACGHDGHTAILLATARLLQRQRQNWAGVVKLVFQPAEELLQGAARMVAEGVLEGPRPDYCLALHLDNSRPVGWLGITPGPIMAGADSFQIRVHGVGGHGAIPQFTRDPIVAASHLVTALQTVVSRNIDPLESGVISVGVIRGGTAFNVIPPMVELKGTIRAYKTGVRATLVSRLENLAGATVEALGCQAQVDVHALTPPVVNDPDLTQTVSEVAARVIPAVEIDTEFRDSASDDMAHMMANIPGCYFFVGSANPAAGLDAPHHDPAFNFDEESMAHGIALLYGSARHVLRP